MSFRAPPTPTEQRARATEELIQQKSTDLQRWAQFDNLATQWDARAQMAAEWIDAGSSVLDIGAGAMTLGGLLRPGCRYHPADVVERRPGCFVVDLNRGEFPSGNYDYVAFLGVLEYIHDIEGVLKHAHAAAARLIVTYCTHAGAAIGIRRGMGWVNELTAAQFAVMLDDCGWRTLRQREVKRSLSNVQLMYECEAAA